MIPVDGRSLSPALVARVAAGEGAVLAPEVRAQMLASEQAFSALPSVLVQKRKFLVGEGEVGPNIVRSFVLGHCAGVGPALAREQVRALLLCRANVLATGHSGVRPALVEALLSLLPTPPVVHSQGSVGAAGDLAPLAHVARVLCGYGGLVEHADGQRGPWTGRPFVATHKEALSLINGATLTAALGALAIHGARAVLDRAIEACALTMAAVHADPRSLSPSLHAARGHSGAIRVATRLRELLGPDRPARSPDAFSLRAAPAVLGAALDTVDWVEHTVTTELNGACDNPLWFAGEGVVEGGNFHGAPVALAMDTLRVALTQVATLSERRTFRLTAANLNGDLPSFLVEGTGLNSGFMLAQYTAASLASECKGLAHPASVDTIPTVQHHEDHVSMGPIAARLALRVLENVADIVGIELLLGAQALDWRLRGVRFVDGQREDVAPEVPPPGIAAIHARVREVVPFWTDDQLMHPALVAVGKLARAPVPTSR